MDTRDSFVSDRRLFIFYRFSYSFCDHYPEQIFVVYADALH